MDEPARPELADLADAVRYIRFRTEVQSDQGEYFETWSFKVIDDLRPGNERTVEQK